MISRRTLLARAAALLAALELPGVAAGAGSNEHERLQRLFMEMEADFLNRSPEHATSLGVDHGEHAQARSQLNDRSRAAIDERRRANSLWARRLREIDAAALSPEDRLDRDVLLFIRQGQSTEAERFVVPIAEPYVLSQRTGAYQDVPEFLVAQHAVGNAADVDTYCDRLRAFAVVLDQQTERVRHEAAAGVIPPDFILDRTLRQLRALRDTPAADSEMIRSLETKARAAGVNERHTKRSAAIYAQEIAPALTRQIDALEALLPRASHDAGVWRLPEGAAYYEACLERQTTSARPAKELSQLGEALVADITAQIDALLKSTGRAAGTVPQRLTALNEDPALTYANTSEGNAQALSDAVALVAGMQSRLPTLFRTLPRNPASVKSVPINIEAGAAMGYYNPGAIDGSRAGIFYLNLSPTHTRTRWQLPSLVYHEAIPGHHMHASIQQESARLPLIRKTTWFSVFNEGWSLYAEQLADESGAYEGDPLGRVGYLTYALQRAVRLVVDTGLHAQRWTRERAIDYFTTTLGSPASAAANEVDRFCVIPGQACSYMAGKQTLLKLRNDARARLGSRFDIRDFHERILQAGSVPMPLLEQVVRDYVAHHR